MYFYYTLQFSAFRRSGFWPRADSGAHAASVLSSGVTEPPISADGGKEEEGKRKLVDLPAAESCGVGTTVGAGLAKIQSGSERPCARQLNGGA